MVSTRTPASEPPNLDPQTKAAWWPKVVLVATIVGALLGLPALLNSSLVGIPELPASLTKFESWMYGGPERYAGTWTNVAIPEEGPPVEGDIEWPSELYGESTGEGCRGHPKAVGNVELNLTIEGRIVRGEASSDLTTTEWAYSHLWIGGERKWGGLRITAWDHVWGRPTSLAVFDVEALQVGTDECLLVTQIHGGRLFPAEFVLARGALIREPAINVGFFEPALKAIREKDR